jgi:hypothetical protein
MNPNYNSSYNNIAINSGILSKLKSKRKYNSISNDENEDFQMNNAVSIKRFTNDDLSRNPDFNQYNCNNNFSNFTRHNISLTKINYYNNNQIARNNFSDQNDVCMTSSESVIESNRIEKAFNMKKYQLNLNYRNLEEKLKSEVSSYNFQLNCKLNKLKFEECCKDFQNQK